MNKQEAYQIKKLAELSIANKELAFQNEEKEKRVAALVIANTDLKKAEEKIIKANRLYYIISRINQLIMHTTDEQTLFKEICNISIELGKFRMAWIGMVNEKTKKVIPVAHCGEENGYLSEIKTISVENVTTGMGPSGTAIREGKHSVCNDIENSPKMAPWKTEALNHGFYSSIALPIKKTGKVVGVFSLYASEPDFFDEREIALLDEIAGDISFALDYFEKDKQRIIVEKELTEKEFFLRESQKAGKIGSYELNFIKGYWKSSETLDNIFGIDQNYDRSIAGWIGIVHPGDQQEMDDYLRMEVIGKQNSFNREYRIVRINDGQTRWVHGLGEIKFDTTGNITEMIGTIHDITERKIAENKLNVTSNELLLAVADLNKILDSSLDVICTINTNGEFVSVSAASQQVWGYESAELIGTKFMDLVYHEDTDIASKAAEKIFRGIQVPIFENRYVHKSGRIVPILWSVNWDKKLQLLFCIAKDVTEKKRLEKAVEIERDQFFDMVSKAPSAIGKLKGADHVFEIVNPLYLQLIGKKDVIGKQVAEVLPEIIEQGFMGILDSVYATGKSYIGTEVLIKFDKEGNGKQTDAYLNFIYQAYRNEEGNIEGIFFFANDITEQILSRKEIEKSEKFFKGVIESSDDMITIIDPAGKTIYTSPAVSKKFGYTNEECLNLNIADIVHPDDAVILQEFVGEIMMHPGEPMECPLIRDRKKDGSYIWVEGTLTNFLKTEGINAIVANFRDVTERKKADEENRFKANLLNTISQAAIATDMNGIVSYWNKAAENIYGWTREEVIGKNIIHLTPSHATREQAFEIMDDLKNGRAWSGEFRVQRKDGTEFPALVTDSPIYDENNKLSGIIGISSDITEKKKLEDLLDKSNRLAKIGNWETDLIKGTVYWSAVTKEIHEAETGYVPDLSQVLNFYKEGKTRDRITQCVQACIEHGTAWDEELQIVTAKGNLKWIKTIGNAEFREGKCIRFYGSFQDIDERKKAELEIKEKAVQLQTLSNNLPDTIMFQFVRELTGVMRFTYISNSVQQLTGKTAEEVMQDPSILYSTIHEDDRQKATEAGEASFRNITPFNEVVHSRNFKGETGWIRVRSVPRKLADGAVIWDGVYTNITEQKKAEILLGQLNETLEKKAVELETSNNELEQFAYVASHDLQEPLRMISGFLQLLEKRIAGQLDETTKQYIGFAVDGAERMKTLIQDLLMYSRIGSNKEDFTIVDLNEVMQYTGRLLEGIIKETGTIITVKSLPVIRANKTLISQLLVNLVSNALKYHGDKKPEIEVGYIEDPGAWIFYVKDNGIGIDSKFFDRVFIIFQRLHNKNEYSGTGIGLAICKKIVEIHKGKIWIESELSKGSTFYFSIPKQTI